MAKGYGSECTVNLNCRSISYYGLICNKGFCDCIEDLAYYENNTCRMFTKDREA